MRVLMVGVDKSTKGGMWTVVNNYLSDVEFCKKTNLKYIPTSITGTKTSKLRFMCKAYLKIFQELKKQKYDIVHIHISERGSVFRKYIVILMARLHKCKVILHMHGAEFEDWYKQCSRYKKKFIRKVIDNSDKILILGNYWRDFICSLVQNPKKVKILYNAVEVPEYNAYNLESSNLLFLGVVGKRKGMDDLLEAMSLIKNELPKEVKLWIYGPDFSYGIEEKIKNKDLEKCVEYKGWLTKKNDVFSQVLCNILPSYNEGLPMTILETMAMGIPNITTQIAAIPEVVSDNNGFLITPGDINGMAKAILSMVNDKELRSKKSMESFRMVKGQFSLDDHKKKLIKIYNELEESN